MTFWTKTEEKAPPKSGELFWAYLFQTGIKAMKYRADFYEGEPDEDAWAYVLWDDEEADFDPKFWAPGEAIPFPEAA